jgi:type IX secretion system PorP/SprF family membrane protein
VAFAGFEDNLNIFSNYRSQWQSIESQPRQFQLNATLPMHVLNGGIGIKFENARFGAENLNSISGSFNRLFENQNITYSAGASIGLSQISINQNLIRTPSGTYSGSVPNHQDPILSNQVVSALYPEYTLAGFLSHPLFDAGISLRNFLQTTRNIGTIAYAQSANIELLGIYYLPLQNGYLLEPGLIIKTNFDQIQTKLFVTLKYGNIFGGTQIRGYSSRSLEAVSLYGGIKFNKQYTITYNFDVLINTLGNVSDGTHELMLKYTLNKEINTGLPPKTMYNPRNL